MGKEDIVKKIASDLEGKPAAWGTGFKLGILHIAKLFEEDAAVLKDKQKTKDYLASKRKSFVTQKWTWQKTVELEDIGKGFNSACTFAEEFRTRQDWKKEEKIALYDSILGLFCIPIPEGRGK